MPSVYRKVPRVIATFWVVKVLTTAMGEAASDYFVSVINPIVAVGFGGVALIAALLLQFRSRRYVPWVYWLTVAMVAVFGTMAADVLHVGLGVPYVASTIFFAASLAIIFALWYRLEGTLSIHSITTARREFFYWATVLATFALGTAAGDWTAISLHLGYLASGVLFAALIAVPAIAYFGFKVSEVASFWFAYIITRPLGASFADWAVKRNGGLGWGDGRVALGLIVLIAILVGYLQITHRDTE